MSASVNVFEYQKEKKKAYGGKDLWNGEVVYRAGAKE